MNIDHLVGMANQIGRFYEVYPNRTEALASAAMHLRRSWDPRMRATLLRHLDAGECAELTPFMAEAIRTHRSTLTPPSSTPVPAAETTPR